MALLDSLAVLPSESVRVPFSKLAAVIDSLSSPRTSAESSSGDIEAMFNAKGDCFMKYAGICEAYATCPGLMLYSLYWDRVCSRPTS